MTQRSGCGKRVLVPVATVTADPVLGLDDYFAWLNEQLPLYDYDILAVPPRGIGFETIPTACGAYEEGLKQIVYCGACDRE